MRKEMQFIPLFDDASLHPLKARERNWLRAMLNLEHRSEKDWAMITKTLRRKTFFSAVPKGKRMEKWSRDGLLYDDGLRAYQVTTAVEDLETLVKTMGLEDKAEEFLVIAVSYEDLLDQADAAGINAAIDCYVGGTAYFLIYISKDESLNAALTFDPHRKRTLMEIAKSIRSGKKLVKL